MKVMMETKSNIRLHLRWMKLLTSGVFRSEFFEKFKGETISGLLGIYLYIYNWIKLLSPVQGPISWEPVRNFKRVFVYPEILYNS